MLDGVVLGQVVEVDRVKKTAAAAQDASGGEQTAQISADSIDFIHGLEELMGKDVLAITGTRFVSMSIESTLPVHLIPLTGSRGWRGCSRQGTERDCHRGLRLSKHGRGQVGMAGGRQFYTAERYGHRDGYISKHKDVDDLSPPENEVGARAAARRLARRTGPAHRIPFP